MKEGAAIARLRALATHPGARGLLDDAAVIAPPLGRELVVTHDMLAAGVHFRADDPPGDIAWKLLAVNLSDLAAMGARPLGVVMGLGLAGEDAAWLDAFADGLGRALTRWEVPLLGGDTIGGLERLTLGLTALGTVEPGCALSRGGARAGDALWVSGAIGEAGEGLRLLDGRRAAGDPAADQRLIARYRRPEPRLALGRALAGVATACMDVSDGLLLDASRLAAASGCGVRVELARVPMAAGADALTAASAGDDYELLFAGPAGLPHGLGGRVPLTRVGVFEAELGLRVINAAGEVVTPGWLGWEHGG